MNEPLKMILVVVRLMPGEQGIKNKIKEVVPNIMHVLQRHARNDGQLAFTDNDGATFGYLLETSKTLRAIRNDISLASGFATEDSCLVVELTGNVDGVGFSRAWNWIDHHQ